MMLDIAMLSLSLSVCLRVALRFLNIIDVFTASSWSHFLFTRLYIIIIFACVSSRACFSLFSIDFTHSLIFVLFAHIINF